jgi:hypothetical protein
MGRALRLLVATALAIAVGGWSQPQLLESGNVRDAAIEGDGHGYRVAAWIADAGMHVAVAERGRDFGPPQTVARAVGYQPSLRVAVGPRGDALLVWTNVETDAAGEYRSVIHGIVLSRDGRVTGPSTLSNPSTSAIYPVVGAGSRGRLGVAWSDEATEARFARVAAVGSGFGSVERVPGRGASVSLAFDPRSARVQSLVDEADIEEVVRSPAGRWSKPAFLLHQPVIEELQRRPFIHDVQFGADARGRQIAVWQLGDPPGAPRVAMRTPPGPLEQSALVPESSGPTWPTLSMARSGAAAVVWQRDFARGTAGEVRVRLRSPGHGFRADELVYQAARPLLIQDVSVAPDGYTAIALEVGDFPQLEPRVLLVRPGGGVRSTDRVAGSAYRIIGKVFADSHGAAALVHDQSFKGMWATRAH